MSNAQIPKKPKFGNQRTGAVDPGRKRRYATNPWTTPGAIISLIVLAVAVLMALVPSLFTNHGPFDSQTTALLAPSGEHWFGTDSVGRDLYARVVYGARETLLGALIAVLVGLVVGTLIGLLAGSQRGWVDTLLMRFVDVLLSIPALLLSLSVIILLGYGTMNAAIAWASPRWLPLPAWHVPR